MPLIRKSDGGTNPSKDDVDPVAMLAAAAPDERWSAARLLAGKPDQAPVLLAALDKEQDLRVREAILTALAKDGGHDAIGGIVSLIRSPDAASRTAALDALAMVPPAIESNIEVLLSDPDRDVRILSCDLVRRLPTAKATDILLALLAREQEVNVCGAAVEVLSEVGDVRARSALKACAARFPKEAFLSYAIDVAIRRIGEDGRTSSPSSP